MKRFWLVIAFMSFCAAAAFSQDTKPAPTATPADNDVVKISTNLIQIDVTVTDSKGKPIPDLKPEEVEIFENGKRQKITNFSFVSNIQLKTTKGAPADNKNSPLLPPPAVRPENVRRTIALVIDDLTLSFGSVSETRRALKKFVNEQMQDGDLVAIIRTGKGIGALQQFTTDKRQLLAAIEKIQFNMSGSARVSAFNPIDPTLKEQLNGSGDATGNTRNYGKDIENEREFESEVNSFRESIFASGTLGAINYIIRGMKDLPGRKSIMLISDGFAMYVRNERGMPQASRILDSLLRLIDLANRASVIIYTIDARGLVFDGLTAEDNTYGLNSDQVETRLSSRRNELFDTQDGLRYLAKQTGGFAYIDQNDMNFGIQRVLNDQSYYLVGFEPDDETFDPKRYRYNKLDVKVKRSGVRVRYRSGFFGISDEQVAKTQAAPLQAIFNALTSPFSVNDVSLRLNALFTTDEKENSYLRSFLHIDTKNLTFVKEPAGTYKTSFDLIASTFGDNGIPQEGHAKTYTVTLTEDEYQRTQARGIVYDFRFPIKKPGAYQMRVAIRDTVTNRLGSAYQFVEVPNLKKHRLTLSGVLLVNLDFDSWQKISSMTSEAVPKLVDPLADTAIRQFRPGSVLTYSTNIYNARSNQAFKADLTIQAKLFGDQTLVFEGKTNHLQKETGAPAEGIAAKGSIRLGAALPVGNYTLQLIVTDNNAKKGRQVAVQFVPFEIVR